jgi:putative addiction module component (TIGR02574 family)
LCLTFLIDKTVPDPSKVNDDIDSMLEGIGTMLTDTKQILESVLALPAIDRVVIVESLLTSLDHPDASIDEIWAEVAEKRLAAFAAGQMKAIPAEEVFQEIENL